MREVEPGRKYTDELAALRAEAREGRLKAERLGRVPWVTGLGLLALLLVFFTIRAGQTRAGVLGSVSYLVVFNALFFGRGYAYSLSILNTEQQIKAFFYGRMLEVAVLTCLVGLLAGLVGTWRRRYLVVDVLEAVVVAVMWPMILVFLQVLYAVYLHGIDFSWFLPDLRLGFKYYLDLLQLVPMGLASIPAFILGLLGVWAASRIAGPREQVYGSR